MITSSNSVRENAPLLSLTIRQNTSAEADAIKKLINDVASEGVWFVTERYVPTTEWENVFSHPTDFPNHLLLVAEYQKRIIGWCRVFPVFGDKSQHVVDLGIGVAEDRRDQDIGTALMNVAIEWAKRQQFEKITLSVFSINARAIHVFDKVGFVRTGVRYKQFKVRDEYVDEVLMERFLI